MLADREPFLGKTAWPLRLYRLMARLPWPTSLTGRLMAICLLGTHVPLAMVTLLLIWWATPSAASMAVFVLLGAAAVASGAGLTFAGMRATLAPVRLSAEALQDYETEHRLPALPTDFRDEAGRLMRQVQEAVIGFEAVQADLRQRAETDPLTGVPNRRSFFARAQEEIGRARRQNEALALVLIDLDHFKAINDQHGHVTGDAVLRLIAGAATRHLRLYDGFARFGGEEFTILLPGAGIEEAVGVAERLRRHIARLPLSNLDGVWMTASLGVAALEPADEAIEDMLGRADGALYDAKRAGRNRVAWRRGDLTAAVADAAPVPAIAQGAL